MSQIFHFEQLDQQSMEPRQGLAHLSGSANSDHSSLPTTAQLTKIFSAAMCSLVMAFFFFILLQASSAGEMMALEPILSLAGQVILGSAMLVLGVVLFVGIPLAVVVWRSTPSSRFLLAIPFLAIVIPLIALIPPLHGVVSLVILLTGIPLAIMTRQSMPRGRFLLAVPLLAVVLLLAFPVFHMFRLALLVILLADLLLTVAVWQWTPPPRIRLRLLIPFLAVALLLLASIFSILLGNLLDSFPFISLIGDMIDSVLSYSLPIIGNLGNLVLVALICGIPIISTIAINAGIRQAAIPDKWLRFTRLPSRLVVFALIVMLLGLFFWGIYLALFAPALFFALLSPLTAPWNSWLLILIGMLVSVVVAARALSSHV